MDLRGDYLIVGSGIAALRAAAGLADSGDVLILTKADPLEGSTGYAQGGIAAALGPDDSPDRHAADTIAAGDGLCSEEAVRALVEEGPRYVRELMDWGARFDCDADGRLALAREGAHSVRRVLHARDSTGREIGGTLWRRVASQPRVRVLAEALAIEAVVRDGRCVGMWFLDREGRLRSATAPATLIATGGAGQVFRETTNPAVATGDGIAIGYRAGARVMDLEFIQFHPTVLDVPGAPRFLLSEALRGEGARLVNHRGEPFVQSDDPRGELAPRDRVARAIAREVERSGAPVHLTLAHLSAEYVHARFPLIAEACRKTGLDLARDPIPVGPAAHYVMGGLATDLSGRTSVPGLFAAGEVACTGVHGANRLASNSLLEGLVFGARAGAAMRRWVSRTPDDWPAGAPPVAGPARLEADRRSPPILPSDALRDLMWRLAGLFRDRTGLALALETLEPAWRRIEETLTGEKRPADSRTWRAISLLVVARLMTRAALRREESRGAHFRSDFPFRDDLHWSGHFGESRHEDRSDG